MRVGILGASGKTGRRLVAHLCAAGHDVVAIGRDPGRLARLDPRAHRAIADLAEPASVAVALGAAEAVVSLAHARYTDAVLAAAPAEARLVLTGSTRVFTALPDPAADAVRAGEAALRRSCRPGVMLHPSMIYGSGEDRNVVRVLDLLRRWPRWLALVVPLPDGGRHWVQPVHVDDMVAAIAAALERAEAAGDPIIVAQPEPMRYADMVRKLARAKGRRARILAVPGALAIAAARCAAVVGLALPLSIAEIQRAREDKRFVIDDLRRRLGVSPCDFDEGVARMQREGLIAPPASGRARRDPGERPL